LSERRHRISGRELEPVTIAAETQLKLWLQTKHPEDEYDAGHLFRLLWRIRHHREGRPDYPEDGEITWSVIEEHLGTPHEMVPLTEVAVSG